MSEGKAIMGMGVTPCYNKEPAQFMPFLAQACQANLDLVYAENYTGFELLLPAAGFIDYGYAQTYRLSINYYDDNEQQPDATYIDVVYELFLPIYLPDDKEISISFYPTQIYTLNFLTFHHHWRWFMEDLKGENDAYFKSHQVIIDRCQQVQDMYRPLMKWLASDFLLIFSNYDYEFETEVLYKPQRHKTYTFPELPELAKRLDSLKIFSLSDLLKGPGHPEFPLEFLTTTEEEVVLTDRMNV